MILRKKSQAQSKLFFIGILLISGAICGSVIANNLDRFLITDLTSAIKNFFAKRINYHDVNKINLLTQDFFKNGKIILLLWLFAFIPFGNFFLDIIFFFKGVAYGFTSSILFYIYKLKGIFLISKFILPSNFILLGIFIFVANQSLRFLKANQLRKKNLLEYVFIFFFAITCVFLVSLLNIYIFY